MTDGNSYTEALKDLRGDSLKRTCFRIVELETYLANPNPTLLYDLGPKQSRSGQRFSPPGNHRGLYVSFSKDTAGAEFAEGYQSWKQGDCAKHVTFDIQVHLHSVLNLNDTAVRRSLKLSKAQVQSPWLGYDRMNGSWPVTWLLGAAAFASGRFDAIQFPSTRHSDGQCLLVFTERLENLKSKIILYRDDGRIWEKRP